MPHVEHARSFRFKHTSTSFIIVGCHATDSKGETRETFSQMTLLIVVLSIYQRSRGGGRNGATLQQYSSNNVFTPSR